jgi:hypothetical protein
LWGYASLAQSAERDRDMVEAAGAEPAGRTSYLEMILVNGEATGAPDKRVAGGAVPPTRPNRVGALFLESKESYAWNAMCRALVRGSQRDNVGRLGINSNRDDRCVIARIRLSGTKNGRLFVTEGIESEWSNGDATIWSDVPHEIIVIFDGRLRPRKAEALVDAFMNVWKDISS